MRQLNSIHRQVQEEKTMLPKPWRVLQEALLQSSYGPLAKSKASQVRKNIPQPLTAVMAQALYGQDLYTLCFSVETFYECEYKYFELVCV